MLKLMCFFLMFVLLAFLLDCFCNRQVCMNSIVKSNNNILSVNLKVIFFVLTLVFVPVILVANRAPDVGVDTIRYMDLFLYGKEYLLSRAENSTEKIFWYLTYFFYDHGGMKVAFFVYALLPLMFVFVAIYKMALKINVFVVTLIFLMLFYQECFNAVRQMPAIAFVFLAYSYALDRKVYAFFICIVLAICFHTSAILALPIYFLYSKKNQTSLDYFRTFVLLCIFVFLFPLFSDLFLGLTIFSKYQFYLTAANTQSIVNGIKTFFLIYLPLIVILPFVYRQKGLFSDCNDYHFLWKITIFFCFLIIARIFSNWFFRLAFYYQIGVILLVGMTCQRTFENAQKTFFNRSISNNYMLVLYFFAFFIYLNYFLNYNVSALVNFSWM